MVQKEAMVSMGTDTLLQTGLSTFNSESDNEWKFLKTPSTYLVHRENMNNKSNLS